MRRLLLLLSRGRLGLFVDAVQLAPPLLPAGILGRLDELNVSIAAETKVGVVHGTATLLLQTLDFLELELACFLLVDLRVRVHVVEVVGVVVCALIGAPAAVIFVHLRAVILFILVLVVHIEIIVVVGRHFDVTLLGAAALSCREALVVLFGIVFGLVVVLCVGVFVFVRGCFVDPRTSRLLRPTSMSSSES